MRLGVDNPVEIVEPASDPSEGLAGLDPKTSFEGGGLLIAFAVPLAMGLIACVMVGWWWFNDLDAVLCGAWRSAHNASPYAERLGCPGGRPAAYMYLPQLAWALAPIARGADISTLRLLFGAANFGVVAGLGIQLKFAMLLVLACYLGALLLSPLRGELRRRSLCSSCRQPCWTRLK